MTTEIIHLHAHLWGYTIKHYLLMNPRSICSAVHGLRCRSLPSQLPNAWACSSFSFLYLLHLIYCCIQNIVLWTHTHTCSPTNNLWWPTLFQPYGLFGKAGMNKLAALSIVLFLFWWKLKPSCQITWTFLVESLPHDKSCFIFTFSHVLIQILPEPRLFANHWARYSGRTQRWTSHELCLWGVYLTSLPSL